MIDRKRELKHIYKETPIQAGVYQIKNIKNNKLFIGVTPNLKTLNGVEFQLDMGSHMNKQLQEDWQTFGKEAFTVEVLETVKKKETGYMDVKKELEKLEEKWLGEIQPYGERGYNRKKIKQ